MRGNERLEYDQVVSALRTQMDGADFDSAWAEGQPLTMEQAIAFALEANHPPAGSKPAGG